MHKYGKIYPHILDQLIFNKGTKAIQWQQIHIFKDAGTYVRKNNNNNEL